MRENIELKGNRQFGDIISDTFVVFRQNFWALIKVYLVMCGLFLITDTITSILFSSQIVYEGLSFFVSPIGILTIVIGVANYTALSLTTLCYLQLYSEKGNKGPTVLEVWGYFRYYFFRVFGIQLLLTIALIISFFFCVIPCIYLLPITCLIPPIMVFENTTGLYAIKRSFKIIKENWWMAFGALLLVSVIVGFAALVLMLPAIIIYGSGQWLTGKNISSTYTVIQSIIMHTCQILFTLPTITIALTYFTITEQKDATGLINRIMMFGKKGHGSNQFPTEQY